MPALLTTLAVISLGCPVPSTRARDMTTSGSTCMSRRRTGFQLMTTPQTTPSWTTTSSTQTELKITAPALRAPKMRPEAISTESTVW